MLNRKDIYKQIEILDVHVHDVPLCDVLNLVDEVILKNQKMVITYVNIHAMNLCYDLPWFREFINQSGLVFCDGHGVRLGALITGQRIQYRFTPPDWVDHLCALSVEPGWKMFFLGSKPGVAELAAIQLRNRHPGLEIETHHGYFDQRGEENQQIIQRINSSGANILFVGMGMPLQERWIKDNYDGLPNVNIIIPVGAMFDYVAKTVPRGPRWLTDNGFEWLTRLIIEPRRLWKRYILGNPLFFYRVISNHLRSKLFPGWVKRP